MSLSTLGGLVGIGGLGTLVTACGGGSNQATPERSSAPPTTATSAASIPFTKELHDLGNEVFAYLQPDGGWGRSNAGLVVSSGTGLLVDTLMDLALTREMLDTMRASPAAAQITTVVNTHADGDHTWGNQLLTGADIVESEKTAEDMASGISPSQLAGFMASPPAGDLGDFARMAFGPYDYNGITITPPTRTFTGSLTLKVGQRDISLLELGPAHSRSDVIVHVPDASVVFAGDLLFNGVHPLISTGPVSSWVSALDTIAALKPRLIVPGHGAVGDQGTLTEFRGYLTWLTEEATRRHARGMTPLDAARDILKASGPYAKWLASERMVVSVTTVYHDLGDNPPSDLFPTLFGLMAVLWKEQQLN